MKPAKMSVSVSGRTGFRIETSKATLLFYMHEDSGGGLYFECVVERGVRGHVSALGGRSFVGTVSPEPGGREGDAKT